ncbi:MAG: hypothetical protein FRX48_08360 [Lasallia pustulata]|uniref:S-adenosyl-L-methionine-dependent methyltransferase-like n=1 Tax=Lasallia pustulata TaxID=136370 RepID=A0A5M8PFB4_9LECA|nr:MAG: hypothetical protein FRX48_08360 [Lasallia pustulata]
MDPTTNGQVDTTQRAPQTESYNPSRHSDLPQHVSQAGNVLEVDSDRSSLSGTGPLIGDRDSAYGDSSDVESAFTSIESSVRDYRKENGRTYHAYKDGTYHLPNDEIEASRLDLQHHLFLLTLDGRLCLAPIGNNLQYVLDVGTGTGIWALDFADQHPLTKIIGTDLSPVQPEFVAPNTVFLIDDSEETWAYNHKFDYIHGRMLVVAIKDFPRLLEQCYENLNPGRWVEMQDLCFPITSDDGSVSPDSSLAKWSSLMIGAGRKVGFDLSGTSRFATHMAAAGFINIRETVYKWPLNSWPKGIKEKLLGRWGNANISEGIQGFSMAFLTRVLGWTSQEVEAFLIEVRKELRDRSKHSYVKIYVVYGQKPGHAGQQQQDDSIFDSSTAQQAPSRHQQDGDLVGAGSSPEPPYRQEEDLFDSNRSKQSQTQQSESLPASDATEPPQWQRYNDPSSPGTVLPPQPQHQQDTIGSSGPQEVPYQPE